MDDVTQHEASGWTELFEPVGNSTEGTWTQTLSGYFPTDASVLRETSHVGENSTKWYMSIAYLLVGTFGVVGNLLVVIVIFNFTEMRKRVTNVFIINQSLLDLLASILIIATHATYFTEKYDMSGPNAAAMCALWVSQFPLWAAFMASTYNLLAMTVERYFKVVHPILHHNSFTRRKAMFVIVVVWLFGLIFNAVTAIPTSRVVGTSCWVMSVWPNMVAQQAVGLFTLFIQFFLPLGIFIYCYAHMIVVIRKKSKVHVAPNTLTNAHPSTSLQTSTEHVHTFHRIQKNLMKTLVIVTLCFALCWSWNQFYFLLINLGYNFSYDSSFYYFTLLMGYSNSCINPVIYILKYDEFKNGMRLLLRWTRESASSMPSHSSNNTVTMVTTH